MSNFSLGNFVSLKNHPYLSDTHNIKIASNPNVTPPIMVIVEILNKDEEHNTSNGRKYENQVKCIYYSHKEGKFVDRWFKINELKLIEGCNTNLNIDTFIDIDKYDLEYIKDTFSTNLVCLKSVDFELNKKKVFLDNTDGKRSNKENHHLDFLPPVMTIIDVVKNKEEVKYSQKIENKKEKDCSKYLFKCKWYNPHTTSYSEDLFPVCSLGLISFDEEDIRIKNNLISEDIFITLNLSQEIELESSKQTVINKLISIKEIIYNHYYYEVGYFDLFSNQYLNVELNKLSIVSTIEKKKIFGKKYPEYDKNITPVSFKIFSEGAYYQIKYLDKLNRVTTRIIKYIEKSEWTDKDDETDHKFLVANCLLRNGKIRHFNLDRIIEVKEILGGSTLFEGA